MLRHNKNYVIKRLKKCFFSLILVASTTACNDETNEQIVQDDDISNSNEVSLDNQDYRTETLQMAAILSQLITEGKPEWYYHWNNERAIAYKAQTDNPEEPDRMKSWYLYCVELLNAGHSQTCIENIELFMSNNSLQYIDLIEQNLTPLIELLGLAYLRLGEVDNCQLNHNEYSCILPLQKQAFHTQKTGSEKAIEIYSLLQQNNPREKYKWIINLAYMTLGEHPQGVPKKLLIPFPNWSSEQKEFPRFSDIASTIGIGVNKLSGGVILDDFNNDGFIDLFCTSYGMNDQAKLFINSEKGFEDATILSGIEGIVSGLNCMQTDYNNDGFKDILILRGGWLGKHGTHPNSLLKNNGDGTFTDVTKSSKILSNKPTQTAAWADVNRDGFLDVFIGNETGADFQNTCELFINQKDGTFKELSNEFGLGDINSFVKGVSFGDINNDKWPDLYVSIMGGQNLLFKNINGHFEEIAYQAGVSNPFYSFPCWFWDVNNDGFEDIFVSGYNSQNLADVAEDVAKELQGLEVTCDKPRLYINNGDETFTDKTKEFGLDKVMYAMGANFGDLDNDGWLDFYVGTGAPDFSTVIPNSIFRNVSGQKFEEITSAGGFGHIQKGHGISFADIDNDGDQDIYAVMGGAYEGDNFPNILLENPISSNNWIIIELIGSKTNKIGIGTKLEIELVNGRKIFYTVNSGGSFGANSIQAEIGLGKTDSPIDITIHWQNGENQTIRDLETNLKYFITEGQNTFEIYSLKPLVFKKDA